MVKEAVLDKKVSNEDFLQEISNYIFTNKYARYNEGSERRETWEETVARLEAMHLKRFSKILPKTDLKKIAWAFDQVREKNTVPSMRSLQFGGKAIETHNARIYNCLHKDTEFITSCGVRTFNDFADGDVITVLTHKGNWKTATVKSFGYQNLNKITIKRVKSEKTIYATENHRWILKDGSFVDILKVGDKLRGATNELIKFDYDLATPEERLCWAYGYVYGDGTIVGKNWSMVRLCGDQIKYKSRFEELGFSTSSSLSINGDFIVYTGKYLKTTPDLNKEPIENIRAFVRGYLDADGENENNPTGTNLFKTIQCSDEEGIEFIRKAFPMAGAYIVSETDLTGQMTNFGVRPYTIKFRIFNHPNNQENSNTPFVVSSIEKAVVQDKVWCLIVEDDESFIFPNGLTTGNCAVRHVDSLRSFSEIFYLLLCGCGVGIGLSRFFLKRLPNLVTAEDKTGTVLTYVVEDTIEGWADSVEALLNCYFRNTPYTGRKIVFDYSRIRKKGAILKISGGKAPGFKGLKEAHKKIKAHLDHIIEYHNLQRMRSVDAYDILMHTADAVLSGGIRRSATAVIFDKDDEDMLNAKTIFKVDKIYSFHPAGEKTIGGKLKKYFEGKVTFEGIKYEVVIEDWELEQLKTNGTIGWLPLFPHRGRSNNSVLLLRNETSLEEFSKIVERTKMWGEPGFVFGNHPWQLFNPCFEIGFIPVTKDGVCGVQFCNLTSQNGRKIVSIDKFKTFVEAATIIGTLQAAYTSFPYLSLAAEELTKEEALLGVSITGIMDNPDIILDPITQARMAEFAKEVNAEWAAKIGINPAARITCVKPEGTSSLFLGTASGIHPHHDRRYFRRVQNNTLDNVYKHFKKTNPHMCEPSVWSANQTDDVITFPLEVPARAWVKSDLTALKHLEYIKSTQQNWVMKGVNPNGKPVEHNVSCTVIVQKDEWEQVIEFLYLNRDFFAAVSLLPASGDKDYPQAPMEAIVTEEDEAQWLEILSKFEHVDYKKLKEEEDNTSAIAEAACAGNACQIINF